MTIGWGYPNLLMSEGYNGPGSPYWALNAFLPLALPQDHPFWATEEAEDAGTEPLHLPQPHAHMVANRTSDQAQVLSAGGPGFWFPRQVSAKYGKLAYSSAFPSVCEPDDLITSMQAESNLAFMDMATFTRQVRSRTKSSGIDGDIAWSTWEVFGGDASVSTVLAGQGDAHVRVHVVDFTRPLTVFEGGFAIEYTFDPVRDDYRRLEENDEGVPGRALVGNGYSTSVIVDPTGEREAVVKEVQPNTSLPVVPRYGAGAHDRAGRGAPRARVRGQSQRDRCGFAAARDRSANGSGVGRFGAGGRSDGGTTHPRLMGRLRRRRLDAPFRRR